METLGHFLDDLAQRRPDAEAIAYAPTNAVTARMTWRELQEESRLAARKLIALGVTKGTRVGFLCPNRIDWLPIAFGVLRLGAALVPLSTLWKRDEIAYGLKHADVALLLSVPRFLKHDYLAALSEIVPELATTAPGELFSAALPSLRRVVLLDDGEAARTQRWNDITAAGDDNFLSAIEEAVSPHDIATVFFTSGTTAQAKAVVHAHAALTISGRRLAPCFGLTPADAWWTHMPLFWSGGFVLGALAPLAGGCRVVLHESVTGASAFELLQQERCTAMAGWHQGGPLLEQPGFSPDKIALRKGTYHALAARVMGPDNHTIGVYGMSETATCVTAARWDDPEPIRCGTFGKPLADMEVRIIDAETKSPLPVGETGEILVKGPTLMEGYLGVARDKTFDAEGFFRTGDLGYLDQSGYLHFATRLKDVIKTAGVNVAAVEIEEALARHPQIKAAHVVGVPHPVRGENIAAFIITHDGNPLSDEILRAYCKEALASYKIPKHFLAIAESEIPKTGSGKIEKAGLRKLAATLLADGDTTAP